MRTRKVIRDSVQSSAGLLKVHILRCFKKISLILCNSDIIFRITFIIKLQTSCGALVTLKELTELEIFWEKVLVTGLSWNLEHFSPNGVTFKTTNDFVSPTSHKLLYYAGH